MADWFPARTILGNSNEPKPDAKWVSYGSFRQQRDTGTLEVWGGNQWEPFVSNEFADGLRYTVYALDTVSSAGQTRTFDKDSGPVQTLSADQDFTLAFSGEAGKYGIAQLYIYNAGAGVLDIAAGTGVYLGTSTGKVTNGNTVFLIIHWTDNQCSALQIFDEVGDLRP